MKKQGLGQESQEIVGAIIRSGVQPVAGIPIGVYVTSSNALVDTRFTDAAGRVRFVVSAHDNYSIRPAVTAGFGPDPVTMKASSIPVGDYTDANDKVFLWVLKPASMVSKVLLWGGIAAGAVVLYMVYKGMKADE